MLPLNYILERNCEFNLTLEDHVGNTYVTQNYILSIGCPLDANTSISMDFSDTIIKLEIPVGSSNIDAYPIKFRSFDTSGYYCFHTSRKVVVNGYTDSID